MPSAIERIADWSGSRPAFSPLARLRAHHAIADTVGCMLAGIGDQATQAVREAFASGIGPEGAAAVAGGGRATEAIAALVNGTAAHALDYDDNFRPGITHASAVLVPALLAVAQGRAASGLSFVDAYLIGLEAQAAVGRGINPAHYTIGWHATSTVGAIGTAAGTAWLMGLDAAGVARAMSVAASMAAGPKGQFGTPAKPLHAGLAARNAVDAAALAEAGMTGRLDILECPMGIAELFGDDSAAGWERMVLASPHVIESDGLTPKRHPCCGSTHNTVDAILDLKAEHRFGAGDVEAVDTLVGIANVRNLAYPDPQDEMQARFSMHYCVALALLQDRLSLADFTPEAVGRPEIRRLLSLTTMRAYDKSEEAAGRQPHRVTIRLKDGRLLKAERLEARGSIAVPFDDADRQAKFADCCAGMPGAAALYARLTDIDAAADLGFLLSEPAEAGRA
ncbi:2-methylcitrate dehydratase [Bosea thiooxidans]|uniref:2-methylcitrate dehydratase n=1 Tax=Bosea thiooxidans TaxID=53254 RepID=A0A0Q3IB37_9HYPH|nr:MmgE/PrpD family protein [Bosea thiooxidans]KQK32152.1 2-methylcitrate dehydratase [Bosea thiooxidans]SKB70721.1 2-methylcitrate dehydratase PrpD [Bosea thiooxidans]